ncbi:uncharacterized protein KRP23_8245 [Phytophthora ramorum]|uniref:uncharacterized protein n=1 Tax=Phytophthora ramorum TaxID=164328 RepID=UPI0030AD3B1E|nr:hypothetical protein KRP23_8245 [Phytophthora ramorum]
MASTGAESCAVDPAAPQGPRDSYRCATRRTFRQTANGARMGSITALEAASFSSKRRQNRRCCRTSSFASFESVPNDITRYASKIKMKHIEAYADGIERLLQVQREWFQTVNEVLNSYTRTTRFDDKRVSEENRRRVFKVM